MNEKERLYFDSLMELAESLGHSNQNPLSLSLLCLGHGISFEQKGKIFLEFNKVPSKSNATDFIIYTIPPILYNIIHYNKKRGEILLFTLIFNIF